MGNPAGVLDGNMINGYQWWIFRKTHGFLLLQVEDLGESLNFQTLFFVASATLGPGFWTTRCKSGNAANIQNHSSSPLQVILADQVSSSESSSVNGAPKMLSFDATWAAYI